MANQSEGKSYAKVSLWSMVKDAIGQKVKETVRGTLHIKKCPKCDSENIEEVLGLSDPLRTKKAYKCNDCGETFELGPDVVQ